MKRKWTVYDITFIGVMAAVIYVSTMFRIPLGESKIHLANGFCLLAGLLFGPLSGGLAAGIGSALYDAFAGGYDIVNVLITFVSKLAMAAVCGAIFHGKNRPEAAATNARPKADPATTKQNVGVTKEKAGKWVPRLIVACVAGALTYVALYMLKTYIFQTFVYHYAQDAVWVTMLAKLIPSLLNAAAAVVIAPLLWPPVSAALRGLPQHDRLH